MIEPEPIPKQQWRQIVVDAVASNVQSHKDLIQIKSIIQKEIYNRLKASAKWFLICYQDPINYLVNSNDKLSSIRHL